MSLNERIEGSKMIVQMTQDIAADYDLRLDELEWKPDPENESPNESSDDYNLTVKAGDRVESLDFSREKLESLPYDSGVREGVKEILTDLIEAMSSYV